MTAFEKVHLNFFFGCRGKNFFILLSLIGYLVFYAENSLCHDKNVHLTTLPSPRGANTFFIRFMCDFSLLYSRSRFLFCLLVLFFPEIPFYPIGIGGKLLFPINYRTCQISIKRWLWPTLRDLLKKLCNFKLRNPRYPLRVHAHSSACDRLKINQQPASHPVEGLFHFNCIAFLFTFSKYLWQYFLKMRNIFFCKNVVFDQRWMVANAT